jgi:Fe-S cluster biogenesis protein NfuA
MSEAATVSAPVSIRAELSVADPDTCKFTVSQTLNPDRERFFENPDQAAGSPLVERLFELAGVVHVLVADNVLVVEKKRESSWSGLKPQIAATVRSQLRTGMPAVLQAPPAGGPGKRTDAEIRELVQMLLDREVNPSVAAHGGTILLTDVKDGQLYIEMSGSCQGCAASQFTLRQGFERIVRRVVPEVSEIIDVTDHAGGRSPYYQHSQ